MRHLLALLFTAAMLSACVSGHFETVVEIAASKKPRTCDGRFKVVELSSYTYRVDACEGTLYYRCFYRRKTMGRTQCCYAVENEAAAIGAAPTCVDFMD